MDFELVQYSDEDFWKVLVGAPGPVVGTRGPIFRYTVYVQRGLRVDRASVARQIDRTLADKRGWTRGAVRFQRVLEGADTDCLLAKPDTVDKLCVPLETDGYVSCTNGRRVVLNIDRWRDAVPHWRPEQSKPGRIGSYRQMVVNHEFGHRTGQNHRYCASEGARAPVMQQQTYGLQGCLANPWPLDEELLR